MTAVDWAIVAVIAVSALAAAAQGFFQEVFSLAGVVAGFMLAAWEYHRPAIWFTRFFSAGWMADAAGFLTIFFACVLFAGIAGKIVRGFFHEVGLGWFDRTLGAAFGLLRGVALVTVVVVGLASFAPASPVLAGSRLSGYFLLLGRGAVWAGPSGLREQLREKAEELRQLSGQPAGEKAGPTGGAQAAKSAH